MSAQITWAVCPNGYDSTNGVYRFSVLVSPQIAALSDLGATPWPTLMRAMSASLVVGSNSISVLPFLDTSVMLAYPGAWGALFPSTAPVVSSARPNYTGAAIVSYDTHTASANVHAAYQELAQAPAPKATLLPTSKMATLVKQAVAAVPAAVANAPLLRSGTLGSGATPSIVRASSNIGKYGVEFVPIGVAENPALICAAMFHNRNNLRQAPAASSAAQPSPATPDFHDVLAQLADQPEVLRALGMILDYAIPAASMPPAYKGTTASSVDVRFVPASIPSGTLITQITPSTLAEISGSVFCATSSSLATTQVDQGLLKIDDPRFLVEQLDLDHAVSTITNAAGNAVDAISATETTSLPTLQARGFNVLLTGRDAVVGARISNAQTVIAAGSNALLQSDDIVRGYRVDVQVNGGTWMSLCKRTGTVSVGPAASAVKFTLPTPATPASDYPSARDEGYVKASAPTSPSDQPALLQVHESLFGWHGWSLVARHPSHSVGYDDTAKATALDGLPGQLTTNASPAGSPYQVTQSVTPQNGSLPRLRYGSKYSFRARVVDLAGNSLPLSAPATHATPAQTFCRYDPVVTPTLVPRKKITEGEALERLVIRSAGGVNGANASTFATTLNAATGHTAATTPDKPGAQLYFATCDRHVAPPKTSEMNAELHGELDALMKSSPSTAFAIASTDGTFLDPQAGWYYVDPQAGSVPATALPAAMQQRGAAPTPGAYAFIDAPSVSLPYLPDPIAQGLRVATSSLAYPQPSVSATLSYAAASWPAVTPFRLELGDTNSDTAPPSINTTGGTMNVLIPAGTMLFVDYSSTIPASALPMLGWYQELVERPQAGTVPAATLAAIEAAAVAGTHWMFTPKRQLQLVHATLKPVQPPTLAGFTAMRTVSGTVPWTQGSNATFAYLSGTIGAHAPSTAHVELLATWSDWDDSTGQFSPHAASVALTQFAYSDGPLPVVNAKHEFADTKARLVTYTPVATTRYREYFPPSMTAEPNAITLAGAPAPAVVLPSTRTPPPPSVLYLVPSFLRTAVAGTSTRQGGALRVYLDRPWYQSGYGEQLAVVCAPAAPPSGGVSASLDKLSQLGHDPTFAVQGQLTLQQSTGMFASSVTLDASGRMKLISNYQLPDGSYVDLVVFNVDRCDPATDSRGLFFVDVAIPAPFQFASLVVARYQPSSISPTIALSSLVRADFTRLSADRTASVTSTGTGISVSVSGPSASTVARPQPVVTVVGGGGGGGGGGTTQELKRGPVDVALITQPTPAQFAADGSAGRYVQATVESTTNPAPADLDNELGWTPVPGASVPLPATTGSGSDPWVELITWSGPVTFGRVSGTRYRVVIREFEVRSSDPDTALSALVSPLPPKVPTFLGNWLGNTTKTTGLDALVYSDILPVT